MAELRELSVNQFVEETASKASVPGGGSVSAMVGALGAALMEMVANLTIGKEKYAGVQEEMQALAAEGAALHEELLAGPVYLAAACLFVGPYFISNHIAAHLESYPPCLYPFV